MDLNLAMIVLQSAVLVIQTYLIIKFFNMEKRSQSTYESDSLFLEIEKTLLDNPKLYEFYDIGTEKDKEYWKSLDENQKRMYIFSEMNYFLFASVYREYYHGRIPLEYWKIYENWLKKLLGYSSIFLQVHNNEKQNFEPEFAEYVDRLMNQ